MEKVLSKSTKERFAKKSKTALVENDSVAARLPVKLGAVIFSFFESELYVLLVKDYPKLAESEWCIPSRLLHYSEELQTTAAGMLFELPIRKIPVRNY